MASGLGGLLTQKIGPFPGYVWALGVGGLVFLLGPKLLGSSGASGSNATQGTGMTSLPGPQGPAGPQGATGLAGLMGAIGLTGPQGPGGPAGPAGTSPGSSGSSSSSSPWVGTAAPPPPSYWTSQGYDVPSGAADAWNAWKAANPDAYATWLGTHPGQGGAGVGGAARNRSASIGSISADPHAYFHPSVKAVPKFPHFVRGGVGGAALAHAAAVHQIAHQAEIHPARLQMLNVRPHRFVRVA